MIGAVGGIMRVSVEGKRVRVKAVAGTRVVLLAIDVAESAKAGLRGFAIKRSIAGGPPTWLKGIKYFRGTVQDPQKGDEFSTREQPLQSFLWSDYHATPGQTHEFTVVPLYGTPGALQERDALAVTIKTEEEFDDHHGIWFNRGAIASHAFATEFHNRTLTDAMVDNVGDDGTVHDPEVAWLSRGLVEACLRYINGTRPGEGLRVCAYEFTYAPVLGALKRALDRGVDVQIVFHDTKKADDANRKAIGKAKLPRTATVRGKRIIVLYPRTRTKIPHNKFIVKLIAGKAKQVWTGSTNFTDSGFLGQTNVGHLVNDAGTAQIYLNYWLELSGDPPLSQAVANATQLTRNPPNVLPAPIAEFFSPRKADNMLDWYAQRIADAAQLVMMTIPFNVAPGILAGLMKTLPALRLVVLEDAPTPAVLDAEKANRGMLVFSNGALMNKSFDKIQSSFGGARVAPVPNSPLDEWFINEELPRPTNKGHVFFVHSKVLIVDPLSADPLVFSGSANFSTNSLTANDENMLLIRGDTRVADIYLTELDRIFRHFYARDVLNQMAKHGAIRSNPLWLDPTDDWIKPNFQPGSYKNARRRLFFPDASQGAARKWADAAARDPDPFQDEDRRAAEVRSRKNAARKADGDSGTRKKPGKATPTVGRKPAAKAKR
jgi:phosphatidylserine/phosphatidylglycerophosphate/cardiolipin synthase-like enzyme